MHPFSFFSFTSTGEDVYQIIDVEDNGNVRMKMRLHSGDLEKKIINSAFDVFTKKYKLAKTFRKLMTDWPGNNVVKNESFDKQTHMSMIQFVVNRACSREKVPKFEIQEKPTNGLFVKDKYLKGTFKLYVYGKVGTTTRANDMPPKAFEVVHKGVEDVFFFREAIDLHR